MHEMILCKLGEVVLKGLNRRSFEDKLMANVNRRVAKCGNFRIYAKQSTIYVEPKDENCDIDAAFEGCKKVFGIIAVSKALPCEKDVQKIIAAAKEYLADDGGVDLLLHGGLGLAGDLGRDGVLLLVLVILYLRVAQLAGQNADEIAGELVGHYQRGIVLA